MDTTLYIRLPNDTTALLNKSLYGAKQPGRNWYFCIRDFLLNSGFAHAGDCINLFFREDMIIGLYVDDMLVSFASEKALDDLLAALRAHYELSVNLQPECFLGLNLHINDHFVTHSIVGSLLFLANTVRPDIAFAVNHASQLSTWPAPQAMTSLPSLTPISPLPQTAGPTLASYCCATPPP
mmetsp:Transcript_41626/g.104975  ORF Transcript_41626/g.104975 Transcript_41626/m.104975 type:complete len:181 (+) Transcript_41626:712-1254(+)